MMDERRDRDLIADEEDRPDFARGQEQEPETLEKEHRGDFAEGLAEKDLSVHTRRGDFAEGQETEERDEAVEHFGDFARGQEREPD